MARHREQLAVVSRSAAPPTRQRSRCARAIACCSSSATRPAPIAAFPPPHTFFWAREIATNLGYNWYRKDSDAAFSFGVRQAEQRRRRRSTQANFALYSARPGTCSACRCIFYPSAEPAQATLDAVLAFTHGDRYKPLPGYQVMNHHYHMDLGQRLISAGSLDADIPDLDALKALGINIVSQIDSVGFERRRRRRRRGAVRPRRPRRHGAKADAALQRAGRRLAAAAAARRRARDHAASVEGARRHSDKTSS